jgi:hypothetical protein
MCRTLIAVGSFRVSIHRRAARACSDFGTYVAFISDHLRVSCPVDGDGLTRILRDAVRDGRLIPAIDRAWMGSRRVARQYAPQSWPKRAPDPKPTVYSFRGSELVPLDASGRFIDDTPYVPARVAAKAAASAGSSGGSGGGSGFDWLGAAGTVAGAVLGGAGSSHDDGGNSMLKSFGDTDGSHGGSLLGDAQPFEYQPDALSDDAFELAGAGRGDMYACDIISSECKGSVLREFPSQYLDSTYNEIQGDARDGMKDARKALKLLNDNRFKK